MNHRAPRPRSVLSQPTPLALAAALALMGGAAQAQTAAPAPAAAASAATPDGSQQVVVTGVRRSAETALSIKKDADKIVDSIVADDIGKFPDAAVADALARVTGVQVRRDSGESTAVLIRGLPQVETLLNGRELFTTTGRYVSLADIPVAMVQRVDVYKSESPDQVEGGIAGIIDVRTNRPFDFKELTVNLNGKLTHSDKAGKTDPTISGMISNRWKTEAGEFGALLGLSTLTRNFHEERAFNTAPVSKGTATDPLTGPDLVGLIPIDGKRDRQAANVAFQWKPSAASEVYLEGVSTHEKNDYELDFFVGLPWWGTVLDTTKIPGTNQLQTMHSQNVFTIMSTQANRIDSNTQQWALGGHLDLGDSLRLKSELTRTDSKFDWNNPILDTITNVPNAFVDTNRGGNVHIEYTGMDMTDPSKYYLKGFFDRYGHDKGDSTEWRGDVEWAPANAGVIQEVHGGLRLATRHAQSIKSYEGNAEAPDINAAPWPASRQAVTTIDGLNCVSGKMAGGGPDYGLTQWYTPCAKFLLDHTDVIRKAITGTTDARAIDPGSFFKDSENTYAVYGLAKLAFNLGSVAVDGTVGGRLVRTEQNLEGNGSKDGVFTPETSKTATNDFLPSGNLRFKLNPQLQARLAAGRTLTRPNFSDLNPGVALVNSSTTVKATGSGGNPNLKAMTGDNYEGALEWYFAPGGSITGTVFSHHFNNYVATKAADEVFNGTTYSVTRPYNTTSGTLNGLEVGYQQFYDKLPGLLAGLGLQANVTFMQGTTSDEGASSRPITGVSRMSYNVAALYELHGVSGRLAYNWRSKFTDSYNQGGPGLDLIVAPVGQLDGSIGYKVNDHLSLVLEGTNLLDTKFRDYWNDQAVTPRDVRRYDRTVSLGVNWRL